MKKKIVFFVMLSIVSLIAAVLISVPELSVEKITDISQTLTVFDKDGNVTASLNSGENRQIIKNIPQNVKDALIATEDIRFYKHNGIDIKRICSALLADIKAGGYRQGASTITQQLIKNSQLTNEKTMLRKIREAVLALQLERQYDKDEILEMYLNFVYFGHGAYGIQTAAQTYFGKDAEKLSVSEAAMLIGILKAPNKYAPHLNMEKAISRRNTVLDQMEKYGYISSEKCAEYKNEKVELAETEETGDHGYYTDYVLEEGARLLGITVSDFMGSGYSVYTTEDSSLQETLQEIYSDKENFPDSTVQSATVVLDNRDASISAMIGGREHDGMRLFNRATAKRQPGSCIKPVLVYAPAFENGSITASYVLDDYRKDFNGYSPTNFKDVYYGSVTVRTALALSLNVPAVEILEKDGIEYSKNLAEKAGIEFDEDDKYLAMALGGMKYGVSPLALAGAYRTFASDGYYAAPWCIEKICDADGNVLYLHEQNESQVMRDSTAFIISDILCDVSKQTGNELSKLKYDIACKTGTVGYKDIGYSDAWSTAFTSSHTVCVWMGYDKTDENNFLDESVTGSTYPSEIARKMHEKIIFDNGYNGFVTPVTVVKKTIDSYVLSAYGQTCLATSKTGKNYRKTEYYAYDNSPDSESPYWKEPEQPENIKVTVNEMKKAKISVTASQSFAEYLVYRADDNVLVGKVSGKPGRILTVTDNGYTDGTAYYVIPQHMSVFVKNEALKGKRSENYLPE